MGSSASGVEPPEDVISARHGHQLQPPSTNKIGTWYKNKGCEIATSSYYFALRWCRKPVLGPVGKWGTIDFGIYPYAAHNKPEGCPPWLSTSGIQPCDGGVEE